MSVVTVERPGLLTTVQDGGRHGLQHLGVPVSGWMDGWSARLANRLAGNPDAAAVLEATWIGPALRPTADVTLAVTGAAFDVTVDGVVRQTPFACAVRGGTAIVFGNRARGARAYIAFGGGIDVPPVLGSRATDVRSALGGVMGRRLHAGDVLALGAGARCQPAASAVTGQPWLFDGALRLLPGLDRSAAAAAAAHALCRRPWRLAPASDRTGYRLEGGAPLPALEGALVSQPVVMGVVQAPPGGGPLLLMADRQTTGGYAVVGVVAAADLPVAAQLGPGDACRFVPCSWDEAEAAAGARERALDAIVSPEA